MEAVNMEQLLNQIRGNKSLLCALEKELEKRDLLDEIYNNLNYEIKDGKINYEIDFYRDSRTGRLYTNDLELSARNSRNYILYNINEDISLKFKDILVTTEHKVKQIPASDYHKDEAAKIVPFDKTCQVGSLSHLMNIYPELFIFLVAYYDIDFNNLKDFSKNEHVYKKEIK